LAKTTVYIDRRLAKKNDKELLEKIQHRFTRFVKDLKYFGLLGTSTQTWIVVIRRNTK